jgi:hypothetical protein
VLYFQNWILFLNLLTLNILFFSPSRKISNRRGGQRGTHRKTRVLNVKRIIKAQIILIEGYVNKVVKFYSELFLVSRGY